MMNFPCKFLNISVCVQNSLPRCAFHIMCMTQNSIVRRERAKKWGGEKFPGGISQTPAKIFLEETLRLSSKQEKTKAFLRPGVKLEIEQKLILTVAAAEIKATAIAVARTWHQRIDFEVRERRNIRRSGKRKKAKVHIFEYLQKMFSKSWRQLGREMKAPHMKNCNSSKLS